MKIRVVSLNMWHGKIFDFVLDYLEAVDADVVLLQETTSGIDSENDNGPTNCFEKILTKLDYEGVFCPGWRLKSSKGNYFMGLGILSKYPIKRYEGNYYFRNMVDAGDLLSGMEFPGVFLEADLDIEGRGLKVISNHFIWSKHPEVTQEQVEAANKLKAILDGYDEFVLGGDFNVTDKSEVYEIVSEGMVDDRPQGLKRSLHPKIHLVGTSKELAVDFVFHKGDQIKKVWSDVEEVPISDHLPVVVEYELT